MPLCNHLYKKNFKQIFICIEICIIITRVKCIIINVIYKDLQKNVSKIRCNFSNTNIS